ncbi:hypothetical protein FB567DRAFT_523726 [Paraphoma chrysanthemicola]|uniref:Uncharacterized protein n=1 Tax=Paraphoma chrysanthemicola TaxID=798071 RepID=A0A8K0R8S1_9PLEO|nr:hypothetical protein FB567DRAFT_523726 [Paraphoma chrysanthemicola]
MDKQGQPRKAAGSSDRGRAHHRNLSTASHPDRRDAAEALLSHADQQDLTAEASPYAPDPVEPQALARRPSVQPQAPNRRLSQQLSESRRPSQQHSSLSSNTTQALQLRNKSSTDSEGWSMLEREGNSTSGASSYDFPGTWPTAIHDTTTALTQVSTATASYASALTNSGIGRASMSIGTAALSSANKRALSIMSWATDHTGTGVDQLPRPMSKWLKGGRKKIEEQRRAEQRIKEKRRRRESGMGSSSSEPMTFGDERGAFVLETAEMSSTGEIVGPMTSLQGDGFREAVTRGGEVDAGRVELDDDSGEESEEEEGDGMLRVFQFDD